MKLYIHPMSSNARRARMAAIVLGHQPELVTVDLQKGEQKKPDYLAINPNGKVPTLVDGSVVIWESLAIMTYLADKKPGNAVYPSELGARANVNKWLFWTVAHWGPAIAQLNYENFMKKMFGAGEPNEYAVGRASTLFHDAAKVLDATFAKSPHVAGETLTLADLAIAAPLMYIGPGKLPVADYAHVTRWFSTIQASEAWKATEPAAH
jgi:glutathione S-transferase